LNLVERIPQGGQTQYVFYEEKASESVYPFLDSRIAITNSSEMVVWKVSLPVSSTPSPRV